jgi:hypothetical protein
MGVTWADRGTALFFVPLVSAAAIAVLASNCVQDQLKCGIPNDCYRNFILIFIIFAIIFIVQQLYFLQMDPNQLRVEANKEILKTCNFAEL